MRQAKRFPEERERGRSTGEGRDGCKEGPERAKPSKAGVMRFHWGVTDPGDTGEHRLEFTSWENHPERALHGGWLRRKGNEPEAVQITQARNDGGGNAGRDLEWGQNGGP